MDRRLSGGGDRGDPRDASSSSRTPMAWRHRDQLYQQQQGYHGEQLYSAPRSGRSSVGQPSRPPRTVSPPDTPDTSNSSSLSSESHVPGLPGMQHSPQHAYAAYGGYGGGGYGGPPPPMAAHAMPMPGWDGEPS
ncbi:uncharacterized protein LOC117651997 [Thrips palmi]|uniref:Uncharacterized protein LOC117651997 n=1 Tax=Thrips palmi TaxID=161013 RepID=A0A6P9A5K5_THRPL|nr:uncharacterized protein LOC117651997 [Thrips palmi]